MHDVAVIGAGLGSRYTARLLRRRGLDARVFEARGHEQGYLAAALADAFRVAEVPTGCN